MPLKVSWLNGIKGNKDKIITMWSYATHTQGILNGFQVTSDSVWIWTALVEVKRTSVTPNESFFVFVENTAAITIDTSGTKKVWLEIPQLNINDAGQNSADGIGIAVINTGASYPSSNYLPLASITSWTIIDERWLITPKAEVEKRGVLLPKCVVSEKTENFTISGTEANNTWFSISTAGGNVTVTLNPGLFPTTNGLYEFTFCKSTGDLNTVTIDVWSGKTIDWAQTYVLSNQWETVTIKIVSWTFAKVVATSNRTAIASYSDKTKKIYKQKIAGESLTLLRFGRAWLSWWVNVWNWTAAASWFNTWAGEIQSFKADSLYNVVNSISLVWSSWYSYTVNGVTIQILDSSNNVLWTSNPLNVSKWNSTVVFTWTFGTPIILTKWQSWYKIKLVTPTAFQLDIDVSNTYADGNMLNYNTWYDYKFSLACTSSEDNNKIYIANTTSNTYNKVLWFIESSVSSWASFDLISGWILSWFSSLTQWEIYYLKDDWTIGLTAGTTSKIVWRAISSTELLYLPS